MYLISFLQSVFCSARTIEDLKRDISVHEKEYRFLLAEYQTRCREILHANKGLRRQNRIIRKLKLQNTKVEEHISYRDSLFPY